jgi:flagellar biosynthesis protein FlhB
MAEQAPREERTEEATPHRLEEARRQGNVAFSREPAQALVLLSGFLWLALILPHGVDRFAAKASAVLAQAGSLDFGGTGNGGGLLIELVKSACLLLAPLMALVLLSPILAAFAQRSVVITSEKLAPDIGRLNPLSGLKRLVSARNLVEVAKNTTKVALTVTIVAFLLRHEFANLLTAGVGPPAAGLALLGSLTLRVTAAVVGFAVLIAALDALWQQLSWRRNLMMTRQELKDELKSTEGQPEVKAKIRQQQRERAKRRMLVDVPKAAVVVTNPTHFAVALAYDSVKDPVPRVVAKGRDLMALRIREVAADAGVPLVADPPTARLLHAALDIGDRIRPEHYQAVAHIIGYVLGRRKREEWAPP